MKFKKGSGEDATTKSEAQDLMSLRNNASLKQFVPATLHFAQGRGGGWYLEFYAYHYAEQKLKRKRVYVNTIYRRCNSQKEFNQYANTIIADINRKLFLGWNPWNDKEDKKKETLVKDVINHYLDVVGRTVRDATMRSYASFCKMFGKWINDYYPNCPMSLISKSIVLDYLELSQLQNKWSPRTYNNNLKQGRAVFSWAIRHGYCVENPFVGLGTLRVLKKKRSIIPAEIISKIDVFFNVVNPAMCIIMRMVYTSLLRPIEISRVQVKQLDFQHHCIHMSGDKTKNWEARDARMDSELENLLRMHIVGAELDDFLFADRQWKCGKNPQNNHSYSKAWEDMRRSLVDEDDNCIVRLDWQLYSLRDTGIYNMVKSGIDSLSVMQAAGHKDLSMTLIYANHEDMELINKLNKQAPGFGK